MTNPRDIIMRNISILQVLADDGIVLDNHNKALCCFHDDKTPSFKVYPSENSFYCFGCGFGGTVISYWARSRGFPNSKNGNGVAMEELAATYGIHCMAYPNKTRINISKQRKINPSFQTLTSNPIYNEFIEKLDKLYECHNILEARILRGREWISQNAPPSEMPHENDEVAWGATYYWLVQKERLFYMELQLERLECEISRIRSEKINAEKSRKSKYQFPQTRYGA